MIEIFRTCDNKLIDCGWYYLLITKHYVAKLPKMLIEKETDLLDAEKLAYKIFWKVQK